ncbi:hypothetical protein [Dongshaea marina]|uniref:hypothetical protein n=1 Tax=Dongshaea marina TaxID=2047966 RepID=UPI001F2E17AD|nr:hypothetical protein [Dongshaea marina]
MNNVRLSLGLAMILLMFPQIAETIYSPALPSISLGFAVKPEVAAQTLSVYFFGFALGLLYGGVSLICGAGVLRCYWG